MGLLWVNRSLGRSFLRYGVYCLPYGYRDEFLTWLVLYLYPRVDAELTTGDRVDVERG
jgi:hypothetical protein